MFLSSVSEEHTTFGAQRRLDCYDQNPPLTPLVPELASRLLVLLQAHRGWGIAETKGFLDTRETSCSRSLEQLKAQPTLTRTLLGTALLKEIREISLPGENPRIHSCYFSKAGSVTSIQDYPNTGLHSLFRTSAACSTRVPVRSGTSARFCRHTSRR